MGLFDHTYVYGAPGLGIFDDPNPFTRPYYPPEPPSAPWSPEDAEAIIQAAMKMNGDEFAVMRAIALAMDALNSLDQEARTRVAEWMQLRYSRYLSAGNVSTGSSEDCGTK